MNLVIRSTEKTLFEGIIEKVTFPTGIGYVTILPSHMSLITTIVKGMVTITPHPDHPQTFLEEMQNKELQISVEEGFMQVAGDEIKALIIS